MTWAEIPEIVRALVASITGIETVWLNAAQSFVSDATQAIARLHWISSTDKGVDDFRYTEVGGVAIEGTKGNRFFTIQVMIDSYSQEPASAARVHVEKLRTCMGWSSTDEVLDANRIAFVGSAALVDHDTSLDDRVISRSSIDLRFSYTDALADAAHPIGWIEHAEVKNTELGIDDTIPPME